MSYSRVVFKLNLVASSSQPNVFKYIYIKKNWLKQIRKHEGHGPLYKAQGQVRLETHFDEILGHILYTLINFLCLQCMLRPSSLCQ